MSTFDKITNYNSVEIMECSICAEPLNKYKSYTTECSHTFHIPCLGKLTMSSHEYNNICPMCRLPLNTNEINNIRYLKSAPLSMYYNTQAECNVTISQFVLSDTTVANNLLNIINEHSLQICKHDNELITSGPNSCFNLVKSINVQFKMPKHRYFYTDKIQNISNPRISIPLDLTIQSDKTITDNLNAHINLMLSNLSDMQIHNNVLKSQRTRAVDYSDESYPTRLTLNMKVINSDHSLYDPSEFYYNGESVPFADINKYSDGSFTFFMMYISMMNRIVINAILTRADFTTKRVIPNETDMFNMDLLCNDA